MKDMRVSDKLEVSHVGQITRFAVRRTQINEALIAIIIGVGFGWIVIYLLPFHGKLIAFGVLTLLTVLAALRALRIRLDVSPDGVTIVNYWRTREIPWHAIEAIAPAVLTQGVLLHPVLAFRLEDGTVRGIQATPRNRGQRDLLAEHLWRVKPQHVRWDLDVPVAGRPV